MMLAALSRVSSLLDDDDDDDDDDNNVDGLLLALYCDEWRVEM
jgi:hypothetical protein